MSQKSINRIRNAVVTALIAILVNGCKSSAEEQPAPADMVNPLMGTDSEYLLSHGNTYPAVAMPFGMNFWTPQTCRNGDGWGYTYDDHKIVGIKQTHQPSPWINDYAAFSLMPVTGGNKISEEQRSSWFSQKSELARPYYYSVYLADHDITAEITPAERASVFRLTFPENDSSAVVIDGFGSPLFRKATITFEDGRRMIIKAPGNDKENIYVEGITLNGKKVKVNYITHSQLQTGGKLEFRMRSTPDKNRGTEADAYPYSMSTCN